MHSPKYQIFVSSPYRDLVDQREQVMKAVLEMGHLPVGMEYFTASDETSWNIITRTIEQSDYYVVIMAHRYGSLAPDGISYTEKEFDFAEAHGIPVQAHLIHDDVAWPPNLMDDKEKPLKNFKSKLAVKSCKWWKTTEELRLQVVLALQNAFIHRPRPGYVRALPGFSGELMEELSQTRAQLARINNRSARHAIQRLRELNEQGKTLPKASGPYREVVTDYHIASGWQAAIVNNINLLAGKDNGYVAAIANMVIVASGYKPNVVNGICYVIDNVLRDFDIPEV